MRVFGCPARELRWRGHRADAGRHQQHPQPDLNPTDPQVVTDSQITSEAKTLGDKADPGKIDESARKFNADGRDVVAVPERQGVGRNPDAMVDGSRSSSRR
jgi:hypothetical protein